MYFLWQGKIGLNGAIGPPGQPGAKVRCKKQERVQDKPNKVTKRRERESSIKPSLLH